MLFGFKIVGDKVVSRVFINKDDRVNIFNLIDNDYIPVPDNYTTKSLVDEIAAVQKHLIEVFKKFRCM